MTPRDAVRRAQEAVHRAERVTGGEARADALSAVTEALNVAAGALERSTDPRSARAGAWYIRDAAAVVWDATERQRHINAGGRDPVRYDVALLPLLMAEHALTAAREAIETADERADA